MPPLPSSSLPKPFLPVANEPLIFRALLNLHTRGFQRISLLIDPQHSSLFSSFLLSYPLHPLVQTLPDPPPVISLHPVSPSIGTADALRSITPHAPDLLVISVDLVTKLDLRIPLQAHRSSHASCTVVVRSRQPEEPSNDYILAASDRLLGLYSTSDISAKGLHIRAALVDRYPSLELRTDLVDLHAYIMDAAVITEILNSYPAISSVRFDLVAYLARRQHTLTTLAREGGWDCPGDQVRINFWKMSEGYAKRASTAKGYLEVNQDVMMGKLETTAVQKTGKKKGKKPPKRNVADIFAEVGERVSVTAECVVAHNVVARDRVSLKKTAVADGVTLETGVKMNGSVIMQNVRVGEAANLNACVVAKDAVVGARCVLKDCRIAAGVTVPDDTDASGRDFTTGLVGDEGAEDEGFEFF